MTQFDSVWKQSSHSKYNPGHCEARFSMNIKPKRIASHLLKTLYLNKLATASAESGTHKSTIV